MGKARRLKAARPPVPAAQERQLIWVDACEIDQHGGCLTIRAGSRHRSPFLIALPARAVAALPDTLQAASLDAEEDYWDVVGPLVQSVRNAAASPDVVNAVVRDWVLAQDWLTAARGRPPGDDELFLVSHVGFVGLAIAPPFAPEPALVIFDPMQLRRLDEGIRGSMAEAIRSAPAPWTPESVAGTLSHLSERPWAEVRRAGPAAEQARAEMRNRRSEFLDRPPALRPGRDDVRDDV